MTDMRCVEGRKGHLLLHRSPDAPRPDRASRFRAVLDGALAPLVERVRRWRARARNGRLLASYNDRMLRDIGVTRAAVGDESTASFWRLR